MDYFPVEIKHWNIGIQEKYYRVKRTQKIQRKETFIFQDSEKSENPEDIIFIYIFFPRRMYQFLTKYRRAVAFILNVPI
jgi:hypothetical protein